MIFLGVAVLVVAIVLAVWVRLLRPIRCTVGGLSEPLSLALLRLVAEGQGFVILDAGKSCVQFCLKKGTKELIVDLPAQQFGYPPQKRDELDYFGFTLREAGPGIYAYQKVVSGTWEAKVLAYGVLTACFELDDEDVVVLVKDYSKQEPPP